MAEGDQHVESLGWRAGLPDDLKGHEAFTSYKTVGDFAKAHLETAGKLKDAEGKMVNSIARLGENATQEERERYFNSLGRPEKPDGYELDGEDKNAPEWTGYWRNEMHKIGVSKDQAKAISASFNNQIKSMVEAHNNGIKTENAKAESELKTEWGEKYDTNVELVQRLWKRDTDSEFEKAFEGVPFSARKSIMRYMFKMAAKTGEDTSSRGSQQRGKQDMPGFMSYDKSPAPPARRQ
jgi:hypothetical protein